jgi:Na+-driven multidrug efflux pump
VWPRFQLGGPSVRADLLRFGGLAIVSQLAVLFYVTTDNLLIGHFYGTSSVTTYTLGARWTPIVLGLIFSAAAGLMPFFTMLEARGQADRSRHVLLRATAATTIVSVPLCLTPCIVGDLFLRHWVGAEFESASLYLIVMLVPAVVEGALSPTFIALGGRGRIGWLAVADIVMATTKIVLSTTLALGFGLGLLGFALGNAVSLLIKNPLLAIVARAKDESFPPLSASLGTLPRALLGAAPGLALLWLVRPWIGGNLASVLAAGVAGGALGLAGAAYVALGPAELRRLWSQLPLPGRAAR